MDIFDRVPNVQVDKIFALVDEISVLVDKISVLVDEISVLVDERRFPFIEAVADLVPPPLTLLSWP